MAIQSTPPIQLDPSMDNGHQLAFINQNFQSIANVLQQNSFVIVSVVNTTMTAPSTPDGGVGVWSGNFARTTIAHNLPSTPVIIAYLNQGSQYYPMMWQLLSTPGGGSIAMANFVASVDATNVYLDCTVSSLHTTFTGGTYNVRYYLLQQTAN